MLNPQSHATDDSMPHAGQRPLDFSYGLNGAAIELIAAASKVRLSSAGNILGYHGTSSRALEILLRTGVLPPGRSPGNTGAIYCAANPRSQHPAVETKRRNFPRARAIEDAAVYANSAALADFVMEGLGIDGSAQNAFIEMAELTHGFDPAEWRGGERIELFGRWYEVEEMARLVSRGRECAKGVILAFDSRVPFSVGAGDYDDSDGFDLRIECPEGLPAGFIVSVAPLGEMEAAFLAEIRKEAGKKF